MALVEEEADEVMYWLELLEESKNGGGEELRRLKEEANQLVAISVSSKKTARNHNAQKRRQGVQQSIRHSSLVTRHSADA